MDGLDLVTGESPCPWGLDGTDTENSDDRRQKDKQIFTFSTLLCKRHNS